MLEYSQMLLIGCSKFSLTNIRTNLSDPIDKVPEAESKWMRVAASIFASGSPVSIRPVRDTE
jgi:hypothetical protein